jgi:hypothetical protein
MTWNKERFYIRFPVCPDYAGGGVLVGEPVLQKVHLGRVSFYTAKTMALAAHVAKTKDLLSA